MEGDHTDHVSVQDQARIRKVLRPRRLSLMASAAGLSMVVALGGAGFLSREMPSLTSPAYAAESGNPAPAGFGDLVAKVKPAVISVRVKIDEDRQVTPLVRDDGEQMQMPPGFQQFERQFGFRGPEGMQKRHQTITGEGSGFFITADGYAVTNNHVVDHAKSVQVTTDDGTIYTAKVVGTDPKTDLALIKVDGKTDFPHVNFADAPARVGDWVVAVGNPFGLGGTVTAGIVSARGRDIGSGPYDDYVQIDAPINKGNSGGPAFDTNGNVIGVNTAIYSPSGGSVGIGFDIPAATAKLVVSQLKDKGYVTRGWLGVQVQPVTAEIADSLGMKQARGALVDTPQEGSPAAKAGIKAGDVIAAVNGQEVKDSRALARTISTMAPGSSVKLDVLHNGESKTIDLTLAEMPGDHQKVADNSGDHDAGRPYLGLRVAPASEVDGAGQKGVVVTGVDPDGPAADKGVSTGDVILAVGGKSVSNTGDVRSALLAASKDGKKTVLMRVKTADSAARFVAVPIAKS
ncbi:Do family serine endopeptidase [Rhodopseudomonas sp. BR0M22]|uniref:Do family serine endopeptidase n=2 Tax=unclassified Rhodopseudomonas TaxID=2638247 RepID=UPI0013DF83DE|nr:Do family serine endopeptidase [Rhodopseudomonas sp. BR0M22]NEW93475.1 Do family serine endopeptidase [Rhodopseudomonas sp. BR0M22]